MDPPTFFVDGGLDVDGGGGGVALLVEGVDGLDVGDDRLVVILVAVVVVVLVVVDVVEVDVEDFVVGSNIVIGF